MLPEIEQAFSKLDEKVGRLVQRNIELDKENRYLKDEIKEAQQAIQNLTDALEQKEGEIQQQIRLRKEAAQRIEQLMTQMEADIKNAPTDPVSSKSHSASEKKSSSSPPLQELNVEKHAGEHKHEKVEEIKPAGGNETNKQDEKPGNKPIQDQHDLFSGTSFDPSLYSKKNESPTKEAVQPQARPTDFNVLGADSTLSNNQITAKAYSYSTFAVQASHMKR